MSQSPFEMGPPVGRMLAEDVISGSYNVRPEDPISAINECLGELQGPDGEAIVDKMVKDAIFSVETYQRLGVGALVFFKPETIKENLIAGLEEFKILPPEEKAARLAQIRTELKIFS